MTRLLLFFLLFFFNFSYSQTSDLGRFTVNVKRGCIPLEIEIISEDIDSSVSVVQYDFNYNTTNNLFNPSSGKSYTYNSKGKYVIAQAINQDGVEKIDILEIEAHEIKDINIDLEIVVITLSKLILMIIIMTAINYILKVIIKVI